MSLYSVRLAISYINRLETFSSFLRCIAGKHLGLKYLGF